MRYIRPPARGRLSIFWLIVLFLAGYAALATLAGIVLAVVYL